MRPPKSYPKLPNLSKARDGFGLIPAQANTRRQVGTVFRFDDEAERAASVTWKIHNPYSDADGFALHGRIESVVDIEPRRKPHDRKADNEPGGGAMPGHAKYNRCQHDDGQKQVIGRKRATQTQRISTANYAQATKEHIPLPCRFSL